MMTTLVIRSSESKHLFPNNKPYDFTIALPKSLVFKEQWTIELSEFYTANSARTIKKELFIHCDGCDMSVVGEQYRSCCVGNLHKTIPSPAANSRVGKDTPGYKR